MFFKILKISHPGGLIGLLIVSNERVVNKFDVSKNK